jgi:hypothetical protein
LPVLAEVSRLLWIAERADSSRLGSS